MDKQNRKAIIAGNWKMNKTATEAKALISELIPGWETSYRNPNFAQTGSAMWNLSPCKEHWFGTDNIGRDMWARTWYGTRTSLLLGFVMPLQISMKLLQRTDGTFNNLK